MDSKSLLNIYTVFLVALKPRTAMLMMPDGTEKQ